MAEDLARASALVLAAVFAVAGLAKAGRPAATARGFAAMDLPAPAALAMAVPAAEIALALLLVLRSPLAGTGALALLAGFSLVLARLLRRGAAVSCGCFASASGERISAAHLVRNALLAVLAVAALAPGQPVVPTLPSVIAVTTTTVAALVALALLRVRLVTGRLLAVELERGR